MSRITVLIPIALATIGLTGCGAPKAINYYAIQIPAAPTPGAASYPIDVVVGRITASSLLEASPIIYRIGRSRIGTYKYHRWQDPPVELVQTKLLSMLRSSGGYRSVSSSTTPESEFLIRGRLHDFAEVDGESISGLVSMEFELYDRKTARVLWSHFYTQLEPVQGKHVSEVAEAIDRNLDRGLREVMAGLGSYFAANPPKKI